MTDLERIKEALGLTLNADEARLIDWLATATEGDEGLVYALCGLLHRVRTAPAPPGDKVMIRSTGHNRWWRPGGLGYTIDVTEAGVFDAAEAARLVHGSPEHKIVRPASLSKSEMAALLGYLFGAGHEGR